MNDNEYASNASVSKNSCANFASTIMKSRAGATDGTSMRRYMDVVTHAACDRVVSS